MSEKIRVNFACSPYDRMQALSSEIQAEKIQLNYIPIFDARDIFDRMIENAEFDASELSASEYITRYAAGKRDLIAIPVFPSRTFRHGFIAVNDRVIKEPKDLNGRRVGVQLYTMTAAVWIRGLLKRFGVDFKSIQWVEGSMEEAGSHGTPRPVAQLKGVKIEKNTSEKSLSQLLEDGEIDGTIGAHLPPCFGTAPHVKRLFPDFKEAEKEYFRETGIFPIMHLVVIRRELWEKAPYVATSLYNALDESKNLAYERMRYTGSLRYMLPWLPAELEEIEEVFKGDPWPYGIEANRKPLEALVEFLYDQSMIDRKIPLDELFAPIASSNMDQ